MVAHPSKEPSIEILRNVFLKNKDSVFLIDSLSGREFTYAQIEHLSLQLASVLAAKSIQKRDKVALLLPNSVEFVVLYFSCMQLGAIPVPININLAAKDISHILSNSNARMLIAENNLQEQINEIIRPKEMGHEKLAPEKSIITFFIQTIRKTPEEPFALLDGIDALKKDSELSSRIYHYPITSFSTIEDDDSIIIVYTSGTTSLPKGVEFTYKNMIANAFAFIETVRLNNLHRFYGILPLSYMAGFYNLMFVPFLAGGSIVIEKTFDFSVNLSFWKKIKRYKINALWLVPSIISSLLPFAYPKEAQDYCNRGNISLIFSGTAPLPESVRKSFEDKFNLSVYNTYGLSELLFISVNSPFLSSVKGVGKALPGCTVAIIGQEGKELPQGERGEIAVLSLYRMRGYFGISSSAWNSVGERVGKEKARVEEPKSIFFPTGDVGYLDAENYLHITDRKKDLIIRGGINISPAEIEEVIINSKMVRDAAVVGVPDNLQGEKIVAVIEPLAEAGTESDSPEKFSETALLDHCRRFLSSFKMPEQCICVSSFPRSVTGKVQKNKLKELILSNYRT